MNIKWTRTKDGYWYSTDSRDLTTARFVIAPERRGTTRVQGYSLEAYGRKVKSFSMIGQAKAEAVKIFNEGS